MKIEQIILELLKSPNIADQSAIYEKYDKNVQGNTVHERGQVAASVITPFRDFVELPEKESKTGVAIATGGNPYLAKIDSKSAAKSAVYEAIWKLACVGANPLAITDCLNFGNPEKKEQMGEFVTGIEGMKEACEELNVPIVSGNVSLYNESNGRSVPPSALISAFGRIDNPEKVPQLYFQNAGDTVFIIGERSENLGGSALLQILRKTDSRVPEIRKAGIDGLRTAAQENLINSASPILRGGSIISILKSCFENELGVDLNISDTNVPGVLFGEKLGAVISTNKPENIQELFGDEALEIGKVCDEFKMCLKIGDTPEITQNLDEWKNSWKNELRNIF